MKDKLKRYWKTLISILLGGILVVYASGGPDPVGLIITKDQIKISSNIEEIIKDKIINKEINKENLKELYSQNSISKVYVRKVDENLNPIKFEAEIVSGGYLQELVDDKWVEIQPTIVDTPVFKPSNYINTTSSPMSLLNDLINIPYVYAADSFNKTLAGVVTAGIYDEPGETFASIRASAGTAVTTGGNMRIAAVTGTGKWSAWSRGIIDFDLTSLGAVTFSSSTLYIMSAADNDHTCGGTEPSMGIGGTEAGTPASHAALATGDYNIAGYVGTLLSDVTRQTATWSANNNFNPFLLNATGLAYLKTDDYTTFTLRYSNDYLNTEPSWASNCENYKSWYNNTVDKYPKLIVEYTSPVSFVANEDVLIFE